MKYAGILAVQWARPVPKIEICALITVCRLYDAITEYAVFIDLNCQTNQVCEKLNKD